ncbi:hypothetical protein SLEP1_g31684 [Rubroshorea leprosula]|nr:hypothetical protein SLEP1_g31684 [Rubroshorea leprosula]
MEESYPKKSKFINHMPICGDSSPPGTTNEVQPASSHVLPLPIKEPPQDEPEHESITPDHLTANPVRDEGSRDDISSPINASTVIEHPSSTSPKKQYLGAGLCPPGANIVGSKWVFKTKLNQEGSIERFKARLVAKGFLQVPGLDFDETFSPVLKPTTLRLVIALATTQSWPLHQLDVKKAFLHGMLKETVYMTQPPGFVDPQYPKYVCCLHRSIYGLKQAPCAWFDRFTLHLLRMGFYCSQADSSLFVLRNSQATGILLLYVGDIVLMASTDELL